MSSNSEFRKTYQSYSDDQLVQLIAKSGSDLIEEAFEALVEEIDSRRLKMTHSKELDERIKLIQLRHKQNLLRRNIYDAKLTGTSNYELKSTLLNGGFSEEESEKIILRLPNLEFDNQEFVNFIKLKSEATRNRFILNLAFFSMAVLAFIVFGISESFGLAFFLAGVLLVLGLVYMLANIDNLIKPDFWLELIKSKPYEFVWIKPIKIKTKLYFVLTINTENFLS
ncbi:MAG: hypothetical protein IPO32_12100 [Crocinitomicaceae bacterium]|nr:hypothetical protein [Crocinitomicaceae bacterium]